MGIAGTGIITNAVSSVGAGIGYSVAGEAGGYIGGLLGAVAGDKLQKRGQQRPHEIKPEETHESNIPYHQQRTTGGTVILSRQKSGVLMLAESIKDRFGNGNKSGGNTKDRTESKLLKQPLITHQSSYGSIAPSDIKPKESRPSLLSQIKDGMDDIYRRISGDHKGAYQKLKSDEDFSKTLSDVKKAKAGTFTIDDSLDIEEELKRMERKKLKQAKKTKFDEDIDRDFFDIERDIRDSAKKQKELDENFEKIKGTKRWSFMEKQQERNENSIRLSTLRTDMEEAAMDKKGRELSLTEKQRISKQAQQKYEQELGVVDKRFSKHELDKSTVVPIPPRITPDQAATRLQNTMRNMRAKAQLKTARTANAATRIQNSFRTHRARNNAALLRTQQEIAQSLLYTQAPASREYKNELQRGHRQRIKDNDRPNPVVPVLNPNHPYNRGYFGDFDQLEIDPTTGIAPRVTKRGPKSKAKQ